MQALLFCLASFLLGIALTLKVIFVVAQRQPTEDRAEGCFGNLLAAIPLLLAAALFAAGILEQP